MNLPFFSLFSPTNLLLFLKIFSYSCFLPASPLSFPSRLKLTLPFPFLFSSSFFFNLYSSHPFFSLHPGLTQFTAPWIVANEDVVFGSSILFLSSLTLFSRPLLHFRLSIFGGQRASTGRELEGRHKGCKFKYPQGPDRWLEFVNGPDGKLASAFPAKGNSCYSTFLLAARWEYGSWLPELSVCKKQKYFRYQKYLRLLKHSTVLQLDLETCRR